MKLNVAQIVVLKRVLDQTGELDSAGRAIPKTYSIKDFSAKKWFDKNTEEIIKNYQKVLKEKKSLLEEKYKAEIEEEKKVLNNLRGLVVKMTAENDNRAEIVESCQKILAREVMDVKILKELEADKELVAEFQEKFHDVKVEKNTRELLKAELQDYKFTDAEAPIVEILDELTA